MKSPLSAPSCPCCAFLPGGDLFLPWSKESGVQALSEDVMAPSEAWMRISTGDCSKDANESMQKVLLVDTHGHPHLRRDIQYADEADENVSEDGSPSWSDAGVISLSCAVSPLDWKDALEYASQSPRILPALGVHPWYLGDIMVDIDGMGNCEDIERYLKWDWLTDLDKYLSQHPHLVVGEIGLCKMARFVREFPKDKGGKSTALQLQKLVFRKQLELAAKWSRPVTVHCVNAHGLFMEVMKDILKEAKDASAGQELPEAKAHWKRAFPPAVAMHSFTGTAHHVGEILALENELLNSEEEQAGKRRRRGRQNQQPEACDRTPGNDSSGQNKRNKKDLLFYFGFSHAVNHIMCTSEKARKKGKEAVRSVPPDRLLVESDVHAPPDVALGTAGAVAYVAQARGEKLELVADLSARNGLRFLSSLGFNQPNAYQPTLT
ncbi:hypothetical protein ACHAWF_013936 [Thalassiosira exigua]